MPDAAGKSGSLAMPSTAMVLAAGYGTRMRPLTETRPKALIEVGGRTLLDHIIDHFVGAGVQKLVVNLHHLGPAIKEHLAGHASLEILFSREAELLETGGAVARALPLLGPEPFWVANADALWLNGPQPALDRMAAAWDDRRMDALLLLHSTVFAYGYRGLGDFLIDPAGLLRRRPECEVSPHLFTGVQLLHPRLFAGMPDSRFSLNLVYGRAITEVRLYGVVHDGEWFHVDTPDALAEAEAYMRVRYAGRERR